MAEFLDNLGITVLGHLLSWKSRMAVYYLAATVAIVFLLWLYRGRPTSFLAWMLPKRVYLHKSNLVDLKVFLVNMPSLASLPRLDLPRLRRLARWMCLQAGSPGPACRKTPACGASHLPR